MSNALLSGFDDTICAISTPAGSGGIAVARVSGSRAVQIVSRLWQGSDIAAMDSHTAHYGHIADANGQLLDEVVLTLFRAPRSYTGEDVIELACHGSVWIQQQLLAALVEAGCRMARAGEFTRRAFANGRMDLTQAEAVADVIAARSQAAHHVALNHLRGNFSGRLRELRDRLLRFVSLIELELDFSEEDVNFADRAEVLALAEEIRAEVSRLADSFRQGNAIRNGVPVAIVGQANAGKSTLLNALLRDDRALVSDIAGTTRDTIEDTITLQGVLFRFIDTAGLRSTNDQIEQMGIERSYRAIDKADIVLWLIDASAPTATAEALARDILPRCAGKRLIAIVNKSDIANPDAATDALRALLPADTTLLSGSAKNTADVARIEDAITAAAALPTIGEDAVLVTNARHYEALTRAGEALDRAINALRDGISGDLLSPDIRDTLDALGEITGEITTDNILGEIFAHFCIGK